MVATKVSRLISAENAATPYQPSSDEVKQSLAASTLRSLPTASITLGGLYGLLTVAHVMLLPAAQKTILVPLAGLSALIFFLFWIALRQEIIPVRLAQPVAGGLGMIALANSLVHLWVSNDLLQSTNLILVIVVVSAFYLSATWFWIIATSAIVGWIAMQVGQPVTDMTVHFGIAIFMAFIAAVLTNRIRMAAYSRLHSLRIQQELHQGVLESHQEQLEARVERRTSELGKINETLRAEVDQRTAVEIALKRSERDLKRQQASLTKTVEEQTVELRNANQALKETADLKSRFMSDISHDIQEPLFDILSKVELMQQGLTGEVNDRQLELLTKLTGNANRILSVLDNVRNVSRLDGSQLKQHSTATNLSKLLESILKTVQPLSETRAVQIDTHFDPNARLIVTDEKRLRHVLNTFTNNAVATVERGGRVGIAWRGDRTAKQLTLMVWNSLLVPNSDSLLERGLPTARQLVQLEGGSFELGRHDDGGAIYTLTLPWTTIGERGNSAELTPLPLTNSVPPFVQRKLQG